MRNAIYIAWNTRVQLVATKLFIANVQRARSSDRSQNFVDRTRFPKLYQKDGFPKQFLSAILIGNVDPDARFVKTENSTVRKFNTGTYGICETDGYLKDCIQIMWTKFYVLDHDIDDCLEPDTPMNGSVFTTFNGTHRIALYKCNQGFSLSASNGSEEVVNVCERNGDWLRHGSHYKKFECIANKRESIINVTTPTTVENLTRSIDFTSTQSTSTVNQADTTILSLVTENSTQPVITVTTDESVNQTQRYKQLTNSIPTKQCGLHADDNTYNPWRSLSLLLIAILTTGIVSSTLYYFVTSRKKFTGNEHSMSSERESSHSIYECIRDEKHFLEVTNPVYISFLRRSWNSFSSSIN